MRLVARSVLLSALVLLLPSAAYAQGAISGVVRDSSGAVLPGVTVEAASPALIERLRSAVTDGTGRYRIVNLVPGTYTVTFTLSGFNTARREGIQLTGSFVADVDVELHVGALEETVTVTGASPIVDVQSTTREQVIKREVIDQMPVSRAPIVLGAMVPAVSMQLGSGSLGQDVGGSTGRTTNHLVAHGSRNTDMLLTYNGVAITNLQTGGRNPSVTNTQAYQEVTVDYAAVSAELAVGGVRVNMIPKDGGNAFKGVVFTSYSNESMQGNNFTQDLKDRGLATPNSIKNLLEVNPGFGGPLSHDKVWFYITAQTLRDQAYTGRLANLNAGNPNAWTYLADPNNPVDAPRNWQDAQARITWQATKKQKFAVSYDYLWGEQPTRGGLNQSPEASTGEDLYRRNYILNFDWTYPLTNRILLEAVGSRQLTTFQKGNPQPAIALIGVAEQSNGLLYRGRTTGFAGTILPTTYYRAALSYVTGTHAFKVGFNNGFGSYITYNFDPTDLPPISYRFNNGVPNQVILRATTPSAHSDMTADLGLYAQDRWTLNRLTLTLGARYDYYKSSFPDQFIGPVPILPSRGFTLPAQDGVQGWRDLTPKLGAAYDLFGNGQTALKVSLNKYVQSQALGGGTFGPLLNPSLSILQSTTRTWTDANRDFVPNCDLANPLANGGECAAMASSVLGQPVLSTTFDPETLSGWGKRPSNWEFSTGLQRQVLSSVSVEVGYFRRWFDNLIVTDNVTVRPSDYDPFSIKAPSDPRLPGGGGYVINDLYDLNPSKFGQAANNVVTFADKFGEQIEHWHGVDIGANARFASGLLIQGGLSSGKRTTDNCDVVSKIDNPSKLYCHVEEPFLTQLKVQSTYTIPRVDVQVGGNFQTFPGPPLSAIYNAPNAVVAPILGRNLSGGAANATVNLIEPSTLYGERHYQLDFRVGKIIRLGRTRTSLNADVYNLLNANPVLTENQNYATFRRPQAILQARFFKIGFQVDF